MENTKGFLRSIFRHADGIDILLMTAGFIGAVTDGVSPAVLLFITSRLMNNVGGRPTSDPVIFRQNIDRNALIMLSASCGFFVACFMEGYCWSRTGERQATRMRSKYMKAVLRQDVGYFDLQSTTTTEVITSVSSDTLVIQDAISEKVKQSLNHVPNFLMNLSKFIGGYIFALVMVWRLALVAFPFVLLLVIPGFMYGRALMRLARRNMKEYNQAGSVAEQAIASVRTVYSFVGERKTMKDFSEALQGTVKLGLKQGLAKGLALGSNGLVFAIWSFMIWYGSRMVMYHGAQGGNVYAVGSLIANGGQALGSAISNLKSLTEACSAGERIVQVIERVPEIDPHNTKGEILAHISGSVEFKCVEFAYPSRPSNIVFRNLNLEVSAGKILALVGASGSGKSTIVSLLQRFYDPIGGEILLDGVNINKLQLNWVRSQMGLVSQEPCLFATSVRENILFGKEDATSEEIIEAAKVANAHNFISQLPQGYNTQVGEGGVQMSGGQKQRIAIARAVIRAPRILLLDEATSALDSESERTVQEALDKAAIGKTTIVVAHRLSTIHNAEKIAVFQNGHVAESGSHKELSQNQNGIYTSLLRLQQMEITTDEGKPSLPCIGTSNYTLSSLNSTTPSSAAEQVIKASQDDKREAKQNVRIPSFSRLLLLNLPEWKQAMLGCLAAALVGAVQPFFGYSVGSLISILFLPNHKEIEKATKTYALLFLGLAVFSLLIEIIKHYNFAATGEYLTKRIRESMLSKILTFEVEWFDQDENSTGAICSRLAKDANSVRSLVGDRMSLLVQTVSTVTISCTLGLFVALRLAVVMIAVQPIVVVCVYGQKMLLTSTSEKAIKAQNQSSKLAAEAVSNIRTVTSFSSQARILTMFNQAQESPKRESNRQSWFAGIGMGTCRIILGGFYALSLWYGGMLVSNGSISSKALFETFFILMYTGRVIADAGTLTSDLAQGTDAVNSVFAVLDRSTRIEPEDPKGFQPDELCGSVEFCNVHFAYPSRPDVIIFDDLTLKIDEGKSTALVGQSGSGKSTIIALIERFYDPLRGSVMIDGRNLNSYHLRCLRKHIALVSQEPTLFAATIKENIAYGGPENINETEILEAARAANAHDFITQLKDGYDTWCGDRGLQLSGGQKQRIAIARAILKNPWMLLLDEATSALDVVTERLVQEVLERVMAGRTRVVVAHRLSTIQTCDQIVVMDRGMVVEKGTHALLLKKGSLGAYYSFVQSQQRHNTVSSAD